MRTLPWQLPSMGKRVLTPDEFASRWTSLDKRERRWVREAAYEGRTDADPELRQLIAAFAWRELRRQPVMWTAFVAFLTVATFGLVFADASVAPLVPSAGMPALHMFHSRRLAAALAKNVNPQAEHVHAATASDQTTGGQRAGSGGDLGGGMSGTVQ